MIVILMGVSGSGKTTVGTRLADALGWRFVEGDELHPAANVSKMSAGHPLDDTDRGPWLDALRRRIDELLAAGEPAVVTCSALRAAYRHRLGTDREAVRLVFLRVGRDELERRLAGRTGHFFDPSLLDSQLAALEPPSEALVVDAEGQPGAIVDEIRRALGEAPTA